MIERLQIQIIVEMAGECSSPELTFSADSYAMSVPPPCYYSGTYKTPVILPKMQVAGYTKLACTLDPTKSEWADYAIRETHLQATCWGTLSHSHLSSLNYCDLILA